MRAHGFFGHARCSMYCQREIQVAADAQSQNEEKVVKSTT